MDRARREAGLRDRVSLIIHHRAGTETAVLKPGAGVVIGRGPPSDVRIADLTLSRQHARFTCSKGVLVVEDLGSTNGTWLRGRRVARVRLAGGQEVLLGGVLVRVHAAGETEEHAAPRSGSAPASGHGEGLVAGPAMQEVLAAAARLSATRIPVLVQGETGTGKEVVARALHERGPRRGKPFVCLNCGAIPAQLVEGTLFGHDRGAFTGAVELQRGVFEEAHGGALLLDEIGELPLPAQAALLRVLETGRLSRVGSSREIAVDVRVVAATHRDLEGMRAAGRFRADLYFRLNGVTIVIPPLRERREDIRPLALQFLREAGEANGRRIGGIAPDALALLERYPWPGNVRELKHAIERAVVVTHADTIGVSDLPARMQQADAGEAPSSAGGGERGGDLRERLQHYEARLILEALRAARGNQRVAARRLGLPLRTLVYKIKALELREHLQ